jgi:hypothetical protein
VLIDGEVDGVGGGAADGHDGRPSVEVSQSASTVYLSNDLRYGVAAGHLAVGLDVINGDHGEMFADACERTG